MWVFEGGAAASLLRLVCSAETHSMLPPNLLIVSMVVFLATALSTAPVEEKEREEVEIAEEGDEELSEEEDDDDDSKSQDKILGMVGVQQTSTVASAASKGSGLSAGPGGPLQNPDPSGVGEASSSAASQSQSGGSQVAELELSAAPAGQSAGNGQKLLNGGSEHSHTGILGSFVGGASTLEHTGTIDPSSHDLFISLMGGSDLLGPDVLSDTAAMSSGAAAVANAGRFPSDSALDPNPGPGDPAHHSDLSIHTSVNSGSDQSPSSALSGSSHSAARGDDSADVNGNGRHVVPADANGGSRPAAHAGGMAFDLTVVTETLVSMKELHTQSLQSDPTASGLGIGQDVTEPSLHTESPEQRSITQSGETVSVQYSQTDVVTMVTDAIGTDTITADPAATPLDQSSTTVQYDPSGQGPEGAENVELEDTC
ncbi:uncharacterized protein LOC142990381 isoform X2 [Genypterus blacodes]|uniref:uncharacterized protein LOC142990381 isoform X2 n=1 Tax=Genypterus blacodes TaxID=154954 RepID=UPI003F75F90D